MTIINGTMLLKMSPIKNMETEKIRVQDSHASYGLSEAGYDIRIAQSVTYIPEKIETSWFGFRTKILPATISVCSFNNNNEESIYHRSSYTGRFALASTVDEFTMPNNLVGEVKDKSTWARKGLSVFNTVIEPGWKGFLTLELHFTGNRFIHIPAGTGIAQVLFYQTSQIAQYKGKYQNAKNFPQEAIYG